MDYCTFQKGAHFEPRFGNDQGTLLEASEQKRLEESMARKKRVKRFRAVTAVKELARERVGAPPAGQIVVEKKKKPQKHKPTLGKLLGETD